MGDGQLLLCMALVQGRLPIRVELKGLVAEDFYRILTEPDNNMIMQQQVSTGGCPGPHPCAATGEYRRLPRASPMCNNR